MKKKNQGITLIALIITIIVMLILVSVTINTAINGGLFDKAKEAKVQMEIANEKEIVQCSALESMTMDRKYNITEENLRYALKNNIGNENLFNLGILDDKFSVTFLESGRSYLVDSNGNIIVNDNNNDTKVTDKTPGDYTDGGKQDGTLEKPFKIESIEDLIEFERAGNKDKTVFTGKTVLLMVDLDFKSSNSYVDSNNTKLFGDYNKDGNTEGIMKEVTKETKEGYQIMEDFTGTLDGQNHTIKNLYINKGNLANYVGFIENLEATGTIKNLQLEGNIKCTSDSKNLQYHRIGGLLGRNEGGVVENCSSNVIIDVNIKIAITNQTPSYSYDPNMYVGGLVGNNVGTINKCENYGKINMKFEINKQDTAVYSIYNEIGGIAGKNRGKIQNSINYGDINYEGSRLTQNERTEHESIGGIVGDTSSSTIKNCINLGNITTKTVEKLYIGGIAGDTTSSTEENVENNYNRGKIQSTMETSETQQLKIGGIVGDGDCNIKNCYNRGEVNHIGTTKTKYMGAIVGDSLSSSTYVNCKYLEMGDLRGAEGKDQDGSGNSILKVPNFTEIEVVQTLNANVQEHNNGSDEKWTKWEIVGGTIKKK